MDCMILPYIHIAYTERVICSDREIFFAPICIALPGEVLGMKTSCNQLLLIDFATNIFAHAHED